MELKLLGSLAAMVFAAIWLSGCAFMGVKEVDAWGLKWANYAGSKVSAGFNNVDYVDDYEGVGDRSRPSASVQQARY